MTCNDLFQNKENKAKISTQSNFISKKLAKHTPKSESVSFYIYKRQWILSLIGFPNGFRTFYWQFMFTGVGFVLKLAKENTRRVIQQVLEFQQK